MTRWTLAPIFLFALCAPPIPLAAQLSGDFTIDPKGTGSRNYKSFGAAVFDFWKNGINGPVTVVVATGTYTETLAMVPIQGMSATNTMTFRGATRHGVTMSPLARAAVTFNYSSTATPIRGVILDGFGFAPNRSSSGIDGRTFSANIEVKNCLFNGPGWSGITASDVSKWEVHHCLFQNLIEMVNITNYDDCSFYSNEFRNSGDRGVQFTKAKIPLSGPLKIYNNQFKGTPARSYSALSLKNGAFGAEISHNTFRISTNDRFTGCLHLMGAIGVPTKVHGNIFVNITNGTILVVETLSRYELQIDGNLYHPSGGGKIAQFHTNSTSNWNFAAWQKVTGQEKSSLQADPQFQSGTLNDLRLKAISPANGKAVGTPTYITEDFDDVGRKKPTAIGAFEELTSKWVSFGTGCPGTLNVVPLMLTRGVVRMGSKDFSILLTNALGGSNVGAFLVIGASKQTIPFGKCNLLVAPHLVLPMAVGGGSGPGQGIIIFRANLPTDAKLRGSNSHIQWAVADPGAGTGGLAFTTAATLTL
jgi:Right handed beta helix region